MSCSAVVNLAVDKKCHWVERGESWLAVLVLLYSGRAPPATILFCNSPLASSDETQWL